MHSRGFLHKWLADACPWMHAVRREALAVTVWSAAVGTRLTVTGLGRSMVSAVKEKYCIKRADRLLSNRNLQAERVDVYQAQARWVIGTLMRPVILVDWSDRDGSKERFLLRASVPVGGRALTLYEEVHSLGGKEKPRVHQAFLYQLRRLVPKGCRPIVVTDAGFRTPWFKQVEGVGWDWVGRIRHRHLVQFADDEPWIPCKSLYARASVRPKALGQVRMTRRAPLDCQLVLYRAKRKGRVKKTCFGKRARYRHSEKNAAREREPWLLGTSLARGSKLAKRVVDLYAKRMQVEEAFRDLKSARYGLGLELSGTRDLQRFQILLLIAMLATLLFWLLGKATELTDQHRQYQANTVKDRAVLSTVFLGMQVFNDLRVTLTEHDIDRAKRALHKIVKSQAPGS